VTEPFITMSTPPHNQSDSRPDSLRRRRHLAIFMALLVSGVVFGPLAGALYNDGSVFFLSLSLLLWLGVGRFIYHLLAPATKTGAPKAARAETSEDCDDQRQ